MDLYFATSNEGKVKSLKRDFGNNGIKVIQQSVDLVEPRSNEVREIASIKIAQAYSIIKKPVVVIDAGFYIPSLNGFPRAFVNFALETIDLEGILKLVEGKPRECEFKECLAYMDSEIQEPIYFMSYVPGVLSNVVCGQMQNHLWSRLSLIFIPKGSQKTLAEMSPQEYSEWREVSREHDSSSAKLLDWLLRNRIK